MSKKPTKKPVGRPRVPDKSKKKSQFSLKTTDEVAAKIRAKAAAAELTITDYLVKKALA
jgi:hypothetical protein